MRPIITTTFSCRFPSIPGAREGELCAYDFPSCKECPKPQIGKASKLEDPMKSIIWRGWISEIESIKK